MSATISSIIDTHRDFSRDEWLHIRDRAASDYRAGELFREVVLGTGKLRRELFKRASGSVLDVACGYGRNFVYLTNATKITGIDFSPVMLDLARAPAQSLHVPVELHRGDAEALDFPNESFDTVVSALATCSFLDPIAALHEMRRVCKRNGRILLLEHGRSQWDWLGRYQDQTAPQMVEHSGCRWNQEPQHLVREAGLTIARARRSHAGIYHMIEVSLA